MTKSKRSLRNLAKCGLLLKICLSLFFLSGCSSSTSPTYLKESVDQAIQDICKKEYNTDVRAKLVGRTLWVYLPLEDIFVRNDKPNKYLERFTVEQNKVSFKKQAIIAEYLIRPVPEKEKYQQIKYDKAAAEKIDNVWKVLRRVIFSMEKSKKDEPQFFCLVTADIKNGFLIKDLFYLEDLKKVSYYFISNTEFHHRVIDETEANPAIIGNKTGSILNYRDISLKEFIIDQIQSRIRIKFEKPEVEKNADIEEEISKIIANTIKLYDFKDFSTVELSDLQTKNRVILNRAAILAGAKE